MINSQKKDTHINLNIDYAGNIEFGVLAPSHRKKNFARLSFMIAFIIMVEYF